MQAYFTAISRLAEQASSRPNMELEARLGRKGPSGLSVQEEELDRMDVMLRSSSHFDSTPWSESHCFYYDSGGEALRTETQFCSSSIRMTASTVCKQRKSSVDVSLRGDWAARVCLSEEKPVTAPPELVLPHYVRIRQRASHTYQGSSCSVRYDLTRTWSGPTRNEAEEKQASGALPVCEVELELLRSNSSPDKVAQSLCDKVEDLCFRFGQV